MAATGAELLDCEVVENGAVEERDVLLAEPEGVTRDKIDVVDTARVLKEIDARGGLRSNPRVRGLVNRDIFLDEGQVSL